MLLTHEEKESILTDFPNVKLSYENIIYKKVSTGDYFIVIPKGIKCFAYFINYNNKPVCFIMELTHKKQIVDIKIFNACFSSDLAYGTIFYGTLFYTSGNRFFTIEDIFSYKGNIIERSNWEYKLGLISNILKKDMKQKSYNNSFIVFGLPIITNTLKELDKKLENLSYSVDFVQMYILNQVNTLSTIKYSDYLKNDLESKDIEPKNTESKKEVVKTQSKLNEREKHIKSEKIRKEYVFLIKPDIQDDIYQLFTNDNTECGAAHIPDFETSVMMNKLFRIIKENDNLDALEESDDEEEFENDQLDKFVKLDTSEKMWCKYNYKFKRWIPIKVASFTSEIISTCEFKNIIKYYEQNKKRY
jgi:adenylate kinase family enzyme